MYLLLEINPLVSLCHKYSKNVQNLLILELETHTHKQITSWSTGY